VTWPQWRKIDNAEAERKASVHSFTLAFMTPGLRKAFLEQEQYRKEAMYKRLMKHGTSVKWDDDKTKFETPLLIDGKSYKPPQLFDVTPTPATIFKISQKYYIPCPDDRFFYCHRILPAGYQLQIAQGSREGVAYFTKDVIVPILAERGDKKTMNKTWMSHTPMEIFTQRRGIQLATGTVLVGGLGLGYLLRKVCDKPSVKRVIVVEQVQSLLDWIGPRLRELYPNVAAKVSDWICDDVYNQLGKHGPDTRHLLDIWQVYGKHDANYWAAKKTLKHLWGWGDVKESK
jgi:hypothetical protein